MPDVDVVAVITAKPGSESIVGDALKGLVAPTRAEEGCIAYDLHVSGTDAAVFVTVEKWRAAEDLEAHMQTAHIAEVFAVAGEHLAAPPVIAPLSPPLV